MSHSPIRSAHAVAVLGLLAAGCGGGTTSAQATFRSAYLAARPRVAAIATQVQSTVASTGHRPDVLLASQFTNLGSRVANEGYAVAALAPPVRYNTRLRDLGSALVKTANDLDQLASATTREDAGQVAAAVRALRVDVRIVQLAQSLMSRALGLTAG